MPVVSKELQEERNKINFNIEEFTIWYYGGVEKLERKRSLEKYFLSDPELNLSLDTSYLSYKEKYEEAVRRSTITYRKVIKLLHEQEFDPIKVIEILRILRSCIVGCINKEGDPLMLQFSMFLFGVSGFTNDEQKAEWLLKVINCNILGTYAQTELGHGTNVRGLETTATYDPKSKEFIINTPTLSAYKFWPGNMGNTVNHAIVYAQLYTQNKCYGVHPFIVQIRDLETHKPLKGIKVGDIGNKVGYMTMNNGYLAFDHVKIPLKNMMMKNARVLEDGSYVETQKSILNYGAMLSMRVSILNDTAQMLAKAATIAIRYSLVRRQSPIEANEPEPKIIEHLTQKYKIFLPLVKSIVYKIVADYLDKFFEQTTRDVSKGNLNRMPELHALTSCLKAVYTNEGCKDIETCRLSCGGHGFLKSAGLDAIYTLATAGQTGEGENTVMLLQTARYLMKAFTQALKGEKLTEGVAYLGDFMRLNGKRIVFDDSLRGILRTVQSAAAGKISSAWKKIEDGKRHFSVEQATNQAGILLTRAAELHCHVCILEIAIQEIEGIIKNVSPALGQVFKNILELYAIDVILNMTGDVLQHVDMSINDIEKLQQRLEASLKFFRTSAIGIVDGFDFSDQVISSTLGSYDGNVYENLFAAAQKSPLNQEEVNKSFHLYLKPFMKSNL